MLDYEGDRDRWLLCLKLAETFWLPDEAKKFAGVIFLRSELLPLWNPEEIFKELTNSLDSF